MSFSSKPSFKHRLALGSFIEKNDNKISVVQLDESSQTIQTNFTFDHKFPCAKMMWIPDLDDAHPDLLVTAGETLKIWTVKDNQSVELTSSLKPTKDKEDRCSPLTGFDWNTQY